MGKRNTARKLAMQALYQVDLSGGEISEAILGILDAAEFHPETRSFATDLAEKTMERVGEFDAIIEQYSKGWSLDRINPIDKALLRLALYEINYDDTPYQVVVNEILEICKRYSTDDSPKFINGILGEYLNTQNRGQAPRQEKGTP